MKLMKKKFKILFKLDFLRKSFFKIERKYLGRNLSNIVKALYTENYKTLLKEI